MLPIPTHLKDIMAVDEECFDGEWLEGKIKCTCGCCDVKLKIYGEDHDQYLTVKEYQDDFGFRVAAVCAECGKEMDLIDMAKHGYDGFVCGNGVPVDDADLQPYFCRECRGDVFSAEVRIELEDPEQFNDEVVSDEPEKFNPKDYVNAFDWFTMSIACRNCGRKKEGWVDLETS